MKNEVWVTGVGITCSMGKGFATFVEGLQSGKSFLSPCKPPYFSAFTASSNVDSHPAFPDDRKSWLGIDAARQAWESAGKPTVVAKKIGIFLGVGLSSITPVELANDVYPHLSDQSFDRISMAKDLAQNKVSPRRHIPDLLTTWLAQEYDITGLQGTSFSACAASAQAIAEGFQAIRRGHLCMAMVGGQDSMDHPMGLLSFAVLGALSNDFCRPFDKRRNGFVLGEGSAVLILESAAHAKRRNASPLAKILGTGTSMDAWNVTAPHPAGDGAERSMRNALRSAQLRPEQVDYINAHGTGTPLGDVAESQAIFRVFGGNTPVSSVKGALGHTIAAAGAIESVVSIAALRHRFLPGTAGLEQQDSSCQILAVHAPRDKSPNIVLSNSFGFGGQNCSIVFGAV